MEPHEHTEKTKEEIITEKVRDSLSKDLMQFVNNVTNSNAALQERMEKIVENTVTEWTVKLKYTWRLFWSIIGLFVILTVYLLLTNESRDRQVQMINKLIDTNSTLINDNHTLIEENHTLIHENHTLVDDNHALNEEFNYKNK